MNKQHSHYLWTRLRVIKPGYFFALTIISGVICLFALRANNEHMVRLRNAVYAADKNNTNVTATLQQLRSYVTTHMNTDLSSGNGSVYPPIQLKYTYQRALDQESQTALSANQALYTDAQTYCQQQDTVDFSGRNRVPCVEQYVETHAKLPTVPAALYEFSFISPSWSPDLAGWSLVATILWAVLFLVGLSYFYWPKRPVS